MGSNTRSAYDADVAKVNTLSTGVIRIQNDAMEKELGGLVQ
ncbi:hypothetical protein [Candidatus Nitrososphaera gargensis]|nr:hypothetical protein [Candidatus Nitrososphaera gargensis]